jgi:hypothetical protein
MDAGETIAEAGAEERLVTRKGTISINYIRSKAHIYRPGSIPLQLFAKR